MAKNRARSNPSPRLISLAVASCFATSTALANPTGPTVVNGQVSIQQMGNLLQITNSPSSIINWQSFSIGVNEITRFIQQSASSAVMNRVTGAAGMIDPSVILGALQSNGRVFLINPSGVMFGAGAQIDVAGLVASSLNLSNADFLGNRLRFTEVPGAGSVINQGTINATAGGEVYLVGPAVTNSGLITTPRGDVILAAGNSVELVNPGTPNIRVEVAASDNAARNLGQIVADAGRVGIYAGLVSQGGTVRADSAQVTDDGRIVLKATRSATLEAGSVTSASGPKGGTIDIQSGDTTIVAGTVNATGSADKGGTVRVLGNKVGLIGNASIDASGDTGGGTVLVGGDFQGKNAQIQNASQTVFGSNASIRADATGNGNGGKVILWSDDATRAYGTISTRGGKDGGDGGLVEVSSKGWLDFHAMVDTRAPKGKAGTLLLDPSDVEIVATNPCCGGEGSFTGTMSDPSVFTPGGFFPASRVGWDAIYDQMQSTNVVITTSGNAGQSGNITVSASSPDLGSDKYLALFAHNNITLNGGITNTGGGDLIFRAGWNGSVGSPGVTGNTGNILLNGVTVQTTGNILMQAANNIDINFSNVQAGATNSFDDRTLTLSAGNRLTVGSSTVEVSAGEGFLATLNLFAGTGGIFLTDIGDGGTTAQAIGGNANCCGGSQGGSALVNAVTSGQMEISGGSLVKAQAGNGGADGGAGGDATAILTAGTDMTFTSGGRLLVTAGNGADGAEGMNGGNGGTAMATLTALTGTLTVDNASQALGFGEAAVFSTLQVTGGNGANGGFGPYFSQSGSGGNGGSATLQMTAPNVAIDGIAITVNGGSGGRGGDGSSVAGGNGGNGGHASLLINPGTISITNTTFNVNGGPGGDGGFGSYGAPGGNGGRGGDGTFSIAGASMVSISNSTINVNGGRGGNGGNASSSCDCSSGFSVQSVGGSVGGNGGRGGDATASITGGTISFVNNSGSRGLYVRSGQGGDSGSGSSGSGTRGIGGKGTAVLNAGAHLTVQNSFIGAEGWTGGAAEVALAANGTLTIQNSTVIADAGPCCGPSPLIGGNAGIGLAGGAAININSSSIYAYGGYGYEGGGSALIAFASAGDITITQSVASIGAYGGGSNSGVGGSALMQFGSLTDPLKGTVIINNDDLNVSAGEGSAGRGAENYNLFFTGRTSGGFTVNEHAATVDPEATFYGFHVNGDPAQAGSNFIVTYVATAFDPCSAGPEVCNPPRPAPPEPQQADAGGGTGNNDEERRDRPVCK